MEIIKTLEYPIRYLCNDNLGIIIENEIQKNRGGYELLHYYNKHGRGYISVEVCDYAKVDFLVSAHAELDRENIMEARLRRWDSKTFW